jgi:dipeptidyl aminopeptidase/acylaminoacyl peptidase
MFTAGYDGSRQSFLLLPPPAPDTVDTLVIALHGHGAHQDQFMTPGIYQDAFGTLMRLCSERNLLYVAPEYRGNGWMGPAAEGDICDIIRLLRDAYPLQRVIMLGGSMGGTSALIFAVRQPELVAGVVAVCPATDMAEFYREIMPSGFADIDRAIVEAYGGDPSMAAAEYFERSSFHHAGRLTMPTFIVHGDADAIIPVQHSRRLVDRLLILRAPVRYVEIPGGDHDAPIPLLAPALDAMLSAG